jgi:hypothetical protein
MNGAQEMEPEMLRCLLWLLLHRNGGSITFTRDDLEGIPVRGSLLLVQNGPTMELKAIYPE